MDRSWIRPFFALTAVAVALAVPAVTTAQSPTPVKTPTAVGTGVPPRRSTCWPPRRP